MEKIDPEVEKSLNGLLEGVAESFPEMHSILNKNLPPEKILNALNTLFIENPDLQEKFETFALKKTEDLRQMKLFEEAPEDTPNAAENPLFEAAVIERLQFDGDIPEMRLSPLGKETPAIPVETSTRNPIALGRMLKAVSVAVEDEVKDFYQNQLNLWEDQSDKKELVLKDKSLADPAIYKRGSLAKAVPAETPSGKALLELTKEEQSESAWHFLSTTQGRKTALKGVADLIRNHLSHWNLKIRPATDDLKIEVLAYTEWSTQLGGPLSTQSAFSYIENAAQCMAENLKEHDLKGSGPFYLEVIAVNTVDINKVGWAARIVRV